MNVSIRCKLCILLSVKTFSGMPARTGHARRIVQPFPDEPPATNENPEELPPGSSGPDEFTKLVYAARRARRWRTKAAKPPSSTNINAYIEGLGTSVATFKPFVTSTSLGRAHIDLH